STRDWSSDVCSSDLGSRLPSGKRAGAQIPDRPGHEDLQGPGQSPAARRAAPREDSVVQLTVGELAHGGAALARVDGRVVFVEGRSEEHTSELPVTSG